MLTQDGTIVHLFSASALKYLKDVFLSFHHMFKFNFAVMN